MSQQQEQQQQHEEQLTAIAKSFPMHFHKNGFCSPEKAFYGLMAGENGGWVDRGPVSTDSATKQLINQQTMTGSSTTTVAAVANGGNIHFQSQQEAQASQAIAPYNNAENMTYFGPPPPPPSPAHVGLHHVQPWSPAFFMLPKSGFESYGLPGYSYGPNYCQPPNFNGYPCPVQYGYYPSNQNPEHMLGHRPLNLSDSRLHHTMRPPQFVNAYGELMNHGLVGSELNSSNQAYFPLDQSERDVDDQDLIIPTGSPGIVHREDEVGGGNMQLCDKFTVTEELDVTAIEARSTDYKADVLEVASPKKDGDGKPKKKRGRPKKLPEVPDYRPSSFGTAESPEKFFEPSPKKIPKPNVDLQAIVCTPDAPIIRTPDSSGTSNKAKPKSGKKKSKGTRKQPASVVKVHLSEVQTHFLEQKFQESPFLSDIKDRNELSDRINLHEHRIAVWFQNRRTKERKFGRMPPGPLPEGYTHPISEHQGHK